MTRLNVGRTEAPMTRLNVERTEALPATFVQSNVLPAIFAQWTVQPATLRRRECCLRPWCGRMAAGHLGVVERAACPWGRGLGRDLAVARTACPWGRDLMVDVRAAVFPLGANDDRDKES